MRELGEVRAAVVASGVRELHRARAAYVGTAVYERPSRLPALPGAPKGAGGA